MRSTRRPLRSGRNRLGTVAFLLHLALLSRVTSFASKRSFYHVTERAFLLEGLS